MKKAIILLSGGLDSTTCLALAKNQGYDCFALSFDYNQKLASELTAAKRTALRYGVKDHKIITLPREQFSTSALTNESIAVPTYEVNEDEIPCTHVPARNTIFLSFALAWAETLECDVIFIGVSAIDYSNYPDCRPEYIEVYQKLIDLTRPNNHAIRLITPLIHLSKAETIELGLSLGVDYSQTVSCYQANTEGKACGQCHSCQLRKRGFTEAKVADPTRYV